MEIQNNNRQSTVVNIMKGLLPILVVTLHTSFDATLHWQDGMEPFIRILLSKLGELAVPAFFLISGYYFFTRLESFNWKEWGAKLFKRVRTLIVPFILWISLAFVAKYVWGIAKSGVTGGFGLASLQDFFISNGGVRIFWDRPYHNISPNILGWLQDTSRPIDVPLWYVRDLLLLIVISPLIWWLIKVSRAWILALFFLLYITDIGFPFTAFSLFTPKGLFFYSAGAAFSIYGKEFLEYFRHWRLLAYIVTPILLACSFIPENIIGGGGEGIIFRLFVCAGVVACFTAVDALYDAGRIHECQLLTDSSFFIYACHLILITDISNFLLWRMLPITADWMLVLKVFLRPAVAVGICLLLYVCLKRFAPRMLGLLTGGRG